jgi:hypothetical protein
VNVRDNFGYTPLKLSIAANHQTITSTLKAAGAKE